MAGSKARENQAPDTGTAAGQPGPTAVASGAGEAAAWTGLTRAYRPDDAAAWDDLVARSVNGTILHTRRFLAYHGSRFRDRSLVVTKSNGKLAGVLPAAEDPVDQSVVTSHPGLTYGGLVHDGTLYGGPLIQASRRSPRSTGPRVSAGCGTGRCRPSTIRLRPRTTSMRCHAWAPTGTAATSPR